jgi:hypothetical protein
MFTITVTKFNGEGVETIFYTDVNKYKITDDYLILERKEISSIVYIQKDQVLEFEVNW